ncbi:DUF2264 domain-containing protein [Pedobacter hartonius]|uniref:DUF2264 domain-containing protein n=1 Tax=Pedobacter hartonius TaxID=425514 RepID=A0A1H4DSV0_9SPHI|nr:DUF2264 domain-containing protein [Pedobacter hartonius]SEA75855.1 hypothetical protein SAMN05443550_10592 [Pedobacter hartonius]
MNRRFFVSLLPAAASLSVLAPGSALAAAPENTTQAENAKASAKATDAAEINSLNGAAAANARKYWVNTLIKIADPVLLNLSKGRLKATMPVEVNPSGKLDRTKVTYLEALGRLMAGMSPWLELGPDQTEEGKLRAKYILLAQQSIAQAVDPSSPDFMQFTGQEYEQALVDGAFLAQALIRAPKQLWEPLLPEVKAKVIKALQSTRVIKPGYNNWLLFMGMIEAFFLKFDAEYDVVRLDYALKKHDEWYKGDGMYGDGPTFHWDYYNSYVIQPMLVDISTVMAEKGKINKENYTTILNRAVRYAVIQERLISPEGTFPVIGRSLAYRFGAMQGLSQTALLKRLPESIKPAQVREALTLLIRRMIEAPGTFDKKGWLTIGFCGHQIDVGEYYISTGSLYLCTTGMLALGLPSSDPFWTDPAADWTARKVWGGENFMADHSVL